MTLDTKIPILSNRIKNKIDRNFNYFEIDEHRNYVINFLLNRNRTNEGSVCVVKRFFCETVDFIDLYYYVLTNNNLIWAGAVTPTSFHFM